MLDSYSQPTSENARTEETAKSKVLVTIVGGVFTLTDLIRTNMDLTIVSLVASVASFVLAMVTILIAYHQKNQTDKLLNDIKAEAKVLTGYGMGELQKSNDVIRKLAADAQTLSIGKVSGDAQKQLRSKLDAIQIELRQTQEKHLKSLPTNVVGLGKAMQVYPEDNVGDIIVYNIPSLFGLSPDKYGTDWWIENRNGTYRIGKSQFNLTFGEIPEKRLKIAFSRKNTVEMLRDYVDMVRPRE